MIVYPIPRDYLTPIHNVGIVPKDEHSSVRKLIGQQYLGPRRDSVLRFPCLLSIAGKTMDEDDTI